jgi:hypothetical protein
MNYLETSAKTGESIEPGEGFSIVDCVALQISNQFTSPFMFSSLSLHFPIQIPKTIP